MNTIRETIEERKISFEVIASAFKKVKQYCEKEEFKGFDPYDGLNSTFFQRLGPIKNNKLARLVWIQYFKRSPLNFRPLVGIEKEFNPKALALFLTSYCNLYKIEREAAYLEKINFFSQKLLSLRNKQWNSCCWGYNFDWQSRAFFQPKHTPTIVASTFIASALLDAYEITDDTQLLDAARSTCDFILNSLNRSYDKDGSFAFSYSPLDHSIVFNASLLGSRILARVYSHTGEGELASAARKSVEFCCKYQKSDGSWPYGTYSFHQWIDNFHTGYNLECLSDYARYSGDNSFDEYLQRGFEYYIKTFFTDEGVPKYYSNSVYPIDVHAPAQLSVTLYKVGRFSAHRVLLEKVLSWTIEHMQCKKEGFFYYQINRYFSSKIPYMRWAQAWMFYSFSTYFLGSHESQ